MLRLGLALPLLLAAACVTPTAPASNRAGLQPAPDTCGASRYAHLLGRPVSEAPPAGSMPNYRLAGLRAPITMDYSEGRLNIFFDEETSRIVGIRCF